MKDFNFLLLVATVCFAAFTLLLGANYYAPTVVSADTVDVMLLTSFIVNVAVFCYGISRYQRLLVVVTILSLTMFGVFIWLNIQISGLVAIATVVLYMVLLTMAVLFKKRMMREPKPLKIVA